MGHGQFAWQHDAAAVLGPEAISASLPIIQDYDLVGRYGGDELFLVLSYCGKEEALAVTGRMYRRIEPIRIDDHPELKITGSFGMAVLNERAECPDSKELVALADRALYKAKLEGKNRICYLIYQ